MRWRRIASSSFILFSFACGPTKHAGRDATGNSGAGGAGAIAGRAGGSSVPGRDAGSGGTIDVGPVIEAGDPGSHDVTFTVRADRDLTPISPLIYGVNEGAAACRDEGARPTVCRLGGNRWTAYNWETNASNAGSDYCFQNDAFLAETNAPAAPVLELLAEAKAAGAATVVTVPIVDYVAADKLGGSGPPECSGDVRKSGADYLTTRFRRNEANKGAALAEAPDPNDDSVSQDEFVAFLKARADGAKVLFSLDNEPDLWSGTHAPVHREPVSYAELVDRNVSYARAIRGVFPDAEILGFVSYGYNGYINLQSAPDRAGKGEFLEYYLKQMSSAEAAGGERLVDYVDLHWYPEARGGGVRVTESSTAADTVAARVQAPRSLWDPEYVEESWITDSNRAPIRLLPWVRAKIAAHHPAIKLAVTEWNYGAGQHISGAIAAADVLGIFGREGVALATLWPLRSNESFNLAAFRAYRNYDGNGSTFGDTAMHATSSDIEKAAVHASFDAANPDRVVLIAINRSAAALAAGITLAHPSEFKSADVYALTSAAPELRAVDPLTATATNAFVYSMPAESVSVIVPQP